jgi:hypothetical protein
MLLSPYNRISGGDCSEIMTEPFARLKERWYSYETTVCEVGWRSQEVWWYSAHIFFDACLRGSWVLCIHPMFFFPDWSFPFLINEKLCVKLLIMLDMPKTVMINIIFLKSHFSCKRYILFYFFVASWSLMFKLHLVFVWTELAQLTGIAAILRFPLPDLEDIEMWSLQLFNIFCRWSVWYNPTSCVTLCFWFDIGKPWKEIYLHFKIYPSCKWFVAPYC